MSVWGVTVLEHSQSIKHPVLAAECQSVGAPECQSLSVAGSEVSQVCEDF